MPLVRITLKEQPMATRKRLRELLHYDPGTGEWTWLVKPAKRIMVGQSAGNRGSGYWTISFDNKRYYAHRLAFLYMTGRWPKGEVDHINTIRTDNRWSNLREATRQQQCANSSVRRNNKSGYKGVSWQAKQRKWQVHCANKYVGAFADLEIAHAAYANAARLEYREFARAK